MINQSAIYYTKSYGVSKRSWTYFVFFAYVYLFFNSFLLPAGLLYSILLTPFLVLWLYKQKIKVVKIFMIFLLLFGIFFSIHYNFFIIHFKPNTVNINAYLTSSLLYLTCIIFTVAFYVYITRYAYTFEALSVKLLKFNFFFVIVAVVSFVFWRKNNIFWYSNEFTQQVNLPRLKLLTTEASEYSFLLSPFFFLYFGYFYFQNLNKKRFQLFASIVVSLLLSLSYGNLGTIFITLALFILYSSAKKIRSRYNTRVVLIYLFFAISLIVLLFGPFANSGVAKRLVIIFNGNDVSTKARSFDSYIIAQYILSVKNNFVLGIGPGQLKIVGKDIIDSYYNFSGDALKSTVRLPNSMAETMVVFGYLGFIFKVSLEIFLFFKTKVTKSYFRFCIFFFMFLFQFVGSNITNTMEYAMWVLAFSKIFPDEYFKKKTLASS